jgi:hypothetical protein
VKADERERERERERKKERERYNRSMRIDSNEETKREFSEKNR